jgi:hypothetical protein
MDFFNKTKEAAGVFELGTPAGEINAKTKHMTLKKKKQSQVLKKKYLVARFARHTHTRRFQRRSWQCLAPLRF